MLSTESKESRTSHVLHARGGDDLTVTVPVSVEGHTRKVLRAVVCQKSRTTNVGGVY